MARGPDAGAPACIVRAVFQSSLFSYVRITGKKIIYARKGISGSMCSQRTVCVIIMKRDSHYSWRIPIEADNKDKTKKERV